MTLTQTQNHIQYFMQYIAIAMRTVDLLKPPPGSHPRLGHTMSVDYQIYLSSRVGVTVWLGPVTDWESSEGHVRTINQFHWIPNCCLSLFPVHNLPGPTKPFVFFGSLLCAVGETEEIVDTHWKSWLLHNDHSPWSGRLIRKDCIVWRIPLMESHLNDVSVSWHVRDSIPRQFSLRCVVSCSSLSNGSKLHRRCCANPPRHKKLRTTDCHE